MRWLVLVVIMFGTMISSVGGMNSHGIALISEALHASSTNPDTQRDLKHGHVHEDGFDGLATVSHGTIGDHPHHGVDHSHDKAHALPTTWSMATPQLPAWYGHVRQLIEMIQASRLERPPMG
ncbi:MAG: hypothetical protein Q8K41_06080 [Hydrogenophaga sp.]|nr:hypothetical protein [Hydrogenophaga sp.]